MFNLSWPTIYGYDLDTGSEFILHSTARASGRPSIYENKVVWEYRGEGFWYVTCDDTVIIPDPTPEPLPFISRSDLISQSHIQLGDQNASEPDIYGNFVVYRRESGGIYLYNLSTGTEVQLTSDSRDISPKIYGNWITYVKSVYTFPMGYKYYHFLYDLSLGTEMQIIPEPVVGAPADIYENKIVYTANRYGNMDIFMYVLAECEKLNCDDGNSCTDDSCNPVDGCVNVNNTEQCDDGITCTENDICSEGVCAGLANDLICEDGNLCTDDLCHPLDGCLYKNNSNKCDDGLFCTVKDRCSAGKCQGKPRKCDDRDDFTFDGPCIEELDQCFHLSLLAPNRLPSASSDGSGGPDCALNPRADSTASPLSLLLYAVPFLLIFSLKLSRALKKAKSAKMF